MQQVPLGCLHLRVTFMRAAGSFAGLAHALRGFQATAGQASHPILQQFAAYSDPSTVRSCQLQSLASFRPICQSEGLGADRSVGAAAPCIWQHAWQRHACRRHASDAQTRSPPTLKQRLRELMMLVHPDRWTAHPTAQRENERSFKLLNEYLDAAKAVSPPAFIAKRSACWIMRDACSHFAFKLS